MKRMAARTSTHLAISSQTNRKQIETDILLLLVKTAVFTESERCSHTHAHTQLHHILERLHPA